MNSREGIVEVLRKGDVMIVDRGFRDSLKELKSRKFEVKIPALMNKNTSTQLTRAEANESRIVTKTRWMVEARNGHIKCKFRYLDGIKNVESLPFAAKDFRIAVALINAFSYQLESDKNNCQVALQMLALRDVKNHLAKIVCRIPKRSYQSVINLSLFPKLTLDELKLIGLGSYQIKQAKSYCQLHMKDNAFLLYVCNTQEVDGKCMQYSSDGTKLMLVLVQFKSRFESNRIHSTHVLFDVNGVGKNVVKAHCCSCKNGLRTIGCCSHIMTIIWYVYHIDHAKIPFPSSNLNHFF